MSVITATNLASLTMRSYLLSQNAAAQRYAQNEADLSKKLYGVSNLSNALKSLNFAANNDGILNVGEFANYRYLQSQSPVYEIASNAADKGNVFGGVEAYAKSSTLAARLGMTIGPINLYGVRGVSSFAKRAYTTYAVNSYYSAFFNKDSYKSYIKNSIYNIGNLLDFYA